MMLKTFPQSSPVSISMHHVFSLAYRHTPPSTANICFSSLYGWQEYFNYEASCLGDLLLVHHRTGNQLQFLSPLFFKESAAGQFTGVATEISDYCSARGLEVVFQSIPDRAAGLFRDLPVELTEERDQFDYVYLRKDLVGLSGSAYAPKRNLIRQFTRAHAFRYETLTESNAGRCLQFIRTLNASAPRAQNDLSAGEVRMVERLLGSMKVLGVCGGILYAGDEVAATTVGSAVKDFTYDAGVSPTVIVHSEKARIEYKGAYQMINQLFCAHLPESIVYINREEDLGIPGLRKAKMSYNPALFIKKSSAALVQVHHEVMKR